MLHSKIEFNEDIATDVRLFNPFGPNMFYMSLNDSDIKDLLNLINDLSKHQDIKDKADASGQIIKGTRAKENQKNSIVDGEIYPIPFDFDHKNIINELLTNLTLTYAQIVNSHVEDDIALMDDSKALENLKQMGKEFTAQIQAVWYVKMKQGDFHILHEHSTSGATFSGAIYLNVPDIPWPQGSISWIPPGGRNTMYNGKWQIQPKVGDVFMWPAWLMHTVYPFQAEGERTMISFNSVVLNKDGEKVV